MFQSLRWLLLVLHCCSRVLQVVPGDAIYFSHPFVHCLMFLPFLVSALYHVGIWDPKRGSDQSYPSAYHGRGEETQR